MSFSPLVQGLVVLHVFLVQLHQLDAGGAGIYSTCVGKDTLDESPMACKCCDSWGFMYGQEIEIQYLTQTGERGIITETDSLSVLRRSCRH